MLVASVPGGACSSPPRKEDSSISTTPLMRIIGYEDRDELMQLDIAQTLYVNPTDRERLHKLLQEHGAVKDFEFEIRRKDGEVRTVSESSTAVRDAKGDVTAFQGFVLDITERRRAEQEIRRRNRGTGRPETPSRKRWSLPLT